MQLESPMRAVLARIRRMVSPGGTLVRVVQLPSTAIPQITPSPFASIDTLSLVMRLVPPETLRRLAAAHGFRETVAQTVVAAGGNECRAQDFLAGLSRGPIGTPVVLPCRPPTRRENDHAHDA